MRSQTCRECGQSANRRSSRDGLCPRCWLEANPDAVDGSTIIALRERLGLSVEVCAAAINMDAKKWVDTIEDNLQLKGEYARAICAAIETLAEERQQAPRPTRQPTPAPAGACAVDSL